MRIPRNRFTKRPAAFTRPPKGMSQTRKRAFAARDPDFRSADKIDLCGVTSKATFRRTTVF